ncbi:cation transporter [Candidatus Woesearchaeota archaeon]|nr:cation transporter [Candidatus Woesearchaeota archaeon]
MLHAHSPHSHDGHAHGSHREAERGRLLLVMALTGVMMLVELVFGWLTNSLALIGDAGHMLTHFAALSVTFLAILLAARPLTKERTYGLYRAEILAALFNGVFVLLITLYIFYEAYLRFRAPVGIRTGEMLAVAAVGLVVNLAAAGILWGASREDLNVKSAFVHLIGDTLSSVGIIAAGIAIHFTGWSFLDPLVAVILGVVILFWGYQLIRDSVHVLLESVPKDISVEQLKRCVLADAPAIRDLHDIHVWQITSGMYAMTAHAVVDDMKLSRSMHVLGEIRSCMQRHFGITHVNIQFEPPGQEEHRHS